MSTRNEKIKVNDKHGFHYEVDIVHSPHFGFSTAYYDGYIIGQVELGRILEPFGDDDYEWECYEERFSEWSDEIKSNMAIICAEHFNRQLAGLADVAGIKNKTSNYEHDSIFKQKLQADNAGLLQTQIQKGDL